MRRSWLDTRRTWLYGGVSKINTGFRVAMSTVAFVFLCMALSSRCSFAADYVPPSGVGITRLVITSSTNSITKTITDANGLWFKTINFGMGNPCTLWTSDISGTLSGIKVYEIATSSNGSASASSRFVASTDQDGNLRVKLAKTAWSSSDSGVYNFYFHVTGEKGTTFTLNHLLAVADEVQVPEPPEIPVGSKERPYTLEFLETSVEPTDWYATETHSISTNGYFYMQSELEKDHWYFFGVSTNVPSSTLFAVYDPNNVQINLSSLKKYTPWSSVVTNILENMTFLTNTTEHVIIQTKNTIISDVVHSITNESTVSVTTTNELGEITVVCSNFVTIVSSITNVPSGGTTQQEVVEIATNYESYVTSIQTNFTYVTNISHSGMCRDAWRFAPEKSGQYTFLFKGSGSFTMYDAVTAVGVDPVEIEFSIPDGTVIPASGKLKLNIQSFGKDVANILYTTDGSVPTNGLVYSSPLTIGSNTVVRACLDNGDGSFGAIYSAHYYRENHEDNLRDAVGLPKIGAEKQVTDWFVDYQAGPDGGGAIRNSLTGDGTEMRFVVDCSGEGNFSFWWRVSSEKDWDCAIFSTNGVEVARISGETKWNDGKVTVPISGTTQLSWTYSKDAYTSEGFDCVWLTGLEFSEGVDITKSSFSLWRVTYDALQGTISESGATNDTILVAKGSAIGYLPTPTRKGYNFDGWFTKVSSGTKIKTTTKVKRDITCYAHWTANKYTIKFNANGGTGTMKSIAATYDKKVTLTANTFKRVNYTFLGWSTKKDATEAKYTDKQKVKNLTSKNNKTVTLYALWKHNTYTVKFNKNGGAGSMANQIANCGDKTALGKNVFTRDGFVFAGWATKKDGPVVYKNKAKVTDLAKNGKSITLYAVWKPAAWAVGTFTGKGEIGGKAATVKLTVSSDGKISGKFVRKSDKKSYSFKADRFTEFSDGALRVTTTIKYGSKTCSVVIAVGQDTETGETIQEIILLYNDKLYGWAFVNPE